MHARLKLQDIQPFADPKIELEQYPTGPHLAARLLFTVRVNCILATIHIVLTVNVVSRAEQGDNGFMVLHEQVASVYDEFEGQTVVDLGCGTGMLSIGAAILGAQHVIGIDVDVDALDIALTNVQEFEAPLPIDLVRCDVTSLSRLNRLAADTVIMNPPFGTRARGADVRFLRAAFQISRNTVYSLHKSSTREHIARVAQQELGATSAEVLAQLRYDLPATYSFHRQQSKDIDVDLWRFDVRETTDAQS